MYGHSRNAGKLTQSTNRIAVPFYPRKPRAPHPRRLLAGRNESKPNEHYRERIVRAIEFQPE